jgi:transcription antitermination factor NusG
MPAPHAVDITSNGEHHWWAVYTRHQHEKAIADVLSAKGFEIFLPLYDSIRRWKDRQKLLSLPLFPCYVFVRGGFSRRFQILNTPGVHMALTRGDQIAVIPEKEIAAIRRTVEGRFRMEPHPFLRCGEPVRVIRGSLEGVEGILVRKKNQFRLVLSVDMLAKSVAVEIDAADVESIAEPVLSGQVPAGFYRSYRAAQFSPGHWASTEPDIRVVGS